MLVVISFIVILHYRIKTMGLTKTEMFTSTQNKLAQFAKALGHPARIAIVEYLLKADQCITGDIVEELPLAQATVSQHLKELKEVGIIKGNIVGTSVCYCIDQSAWNDMEDTMLALFKSYNQSNCC